MEAGGTEAPQGLLSGAEMLNIVRTEQAGLWVKRSLWVKELERSGGICNLQGTPGTPGRSGCRQSPIAALNSLWKAATGLAHKQQLFVPSVTHSLFS